MGRPDSDAGGSQRPTGQFGGEFGRTTGAAIGARPEISLSARGLFHRPAVLLCQHPAVSPGNLDCPCWPLRSRCAFVLGDKFKKFCQIRAYLLNARLHVANRGSIRTGQMSVTARNSNKNLKNSFDFTRLALPKNSPSSTIKRNNTGC